MSQLDNFLNALSGQESGGNYSAVNRYTGALGRWQVLPGNVSSWARKYLNISLTPQQFLRSPQMQDRLVRAVIGSYVNKYGYRGAASAWYSGNPAWENNYNPQKHGPSIGDYVDSVLKRMGDTGIGGALRDVADQAILAGTKAARAIPGVKPDPLEIGQGLVPNVNAEQERKSDPEATKGLGLDIEDGSGQGQLGIEAGEGIDDPDPLGISTEQPSLAGRAEIGPEKPVVESPADALKNVASGIFNLAGNGFKYYNPLPGYKPSGVWGGRANINISGMHNALDIAAPKGTAVHSPLGGEVIFAGWDPNAAKTNGGFGLNLRIKLDDGNYVILGHLSSIASGLKVGSRVKANQVLGGVGDTGNSTGDHLHMEFRHIAWEPDTAFNFTSFFKW